MFYRMSDAENKSSLNFMSLNTMKSSKTHLVWNTRHKPRLERKKAIIKLEIRQ